MQPGGHRFDPGQLHQDQCHDAIARNSLLGHHGNHVVRLDTVGNLSCRVEADPMVGAVDLCSHIRFLVLGRVEGVLASRSERWREVGSSSMLGVKCDNRESVHGS